MSFDLTTTPSSDIVAFPFLYGVNSASAISGHFTFADPERSHSAYIELPSLVYSDLWDNPVESTEYRIYKIELPENLFNGISIGTAIIVPEVDSKPASYTVFCNIAAGWILSSLAFEVWNGGIGPADSTFNQSDSERGKAPSSTNCSCRLLRLRYLEELWPEMVVNTSETWARYLKPEVENLYTSLINLLLQQPAAMLTDVTLISDVFATLTANGLARTAWDSILQGNSKTKGVKGEGGTDISHR